jgi:hypothetical protein
MKTTELLIAVVAVLFLLGCVEKEPTHSPQYSLYVLGELDRTHVSIWVNKKPLAGGYLSTNDAIGLAFQMPFEAMPGDTLEMRVNEDADSPIKASFVLPEKSKGNILATVQKDTITFEAQVKSPNFK